MKKIFFLLTVSFALHGNLFAQEDFPADAENGFKDLRFGKSIVELKTKVNLTQLMIKTMRPDVLTYHIDDTTYLNKDGFRFADAQVEVTKGNLFKIIWLKNNTDTFFFNNLLEHINNKYGEYTSGLRRDFQVIKQWYFDKTVIELVYLKLTNGGVNVRLSYGLLKTSK